MKSLALAVAIGFTLMMAAVLMTIAVAAMDNPGVHINSIRIESYTAIAEALWLVIQIIVTAFVLHNRSQER